MQAREERLTEIVDAILRYLDSHPDAADTAEGIAKWWLPAGWCADVRSVQLALTRMEAQGLVHRRIHTDRHVLYSR